MAYELSIDHWMFFNDWQPLRRDREKLQGICFIDFYGTEAKLCFILFAEISSLPNEGEGELEKSKGVIESEEEQPEVLYFPEEAFDKVTELIISWRSKFQSLVKPSNPAPQYGLTVNTVLFPCV